MKESIIKSTASLLACALLLSGCGIGGKGKQEQESKVEQEETQASTQAEEVELDIIPAISITQDKKEWFADDGETLLLTASASKIEVIGEGFDALKASLEARWSGLDEKNCEERLSWAKEHYEMAKADGIESFANYSFDKNLTLYRNDSSVISFYESFYEYTGGAHGMYGGMGVTFDPKSGSELMLEDILSNPEAFHEKATDYIIKELEKTYAEELFPEYKETVKESFLGETPASWHLNSTGIVIDYGLYSVVPYVAGAPSVMLPYDEFAEFIKEEYITPHDNMTAVVPENQDISRLLGETGIVMIETVYNEESSTSEVTVASGDAYEMVDIAGHFKDARVIKRDGRSFLIVTCYYAADDFVTFVYEVTGGKVSQCDRLEGVGFEWSENCLIGADRIGLYVCSDVEGKYLGWIEYILDDNGRLVPVIEIE